MGIKTGKELAALTSGGAPTAALNIENVKQFKVAPLCAAEADK